MKKLDELIANEKLFRRRNEALIKVAEFNDTRATLEFFCECSDVTCRQIIRLSADDYKKIHNNRRNFILKPGHETSEIESVIETKKSFNIVEKLSEFV